MYCGSIILNNTYFIYEERVERERDNGGLQYDLVVKMVEQGDYISFRSLGPQTSGTGLFRPCSKGQAAAR